MEDIRHGAQRVAVVERKLARLHQFEETVETCARVLIVLANREACATTLGAKR